MSAEPIPAPETDGPAAETDAPQTQTSLPPAERNTVSVYEAKTHLSRLLDRAAAGGRIIVTKHGRPYAEIGALRENLPIRTPGAWKGRVWMSPDFDEFTEQDERDWYGE